MTEDRFWDIVNQSRDGVRPGTVDEDANDRQSAKLTSLLETLSPDEIVAFDTVMHAVHRRSNHWDLWGVAYIISGGCSDDAFEYFRRWLLAQGRETFEQSVRDPDNLAQIIAIDNDMEPDFEGFFHVAGDVYEAKTGKDLNDVFPNIVYEGESDASEPQGDRWDEDDLPQRFPKTCAKFGWEEDAEENP
ncbi:MAG: DUF4240 domain-containing protein [Akkermansiaceae bacterium]|nr:DUF4240 domain-containing protein [Armatimonadota bacterium]